MPILQQFRPYAVDFTGWLDDFSHSGIYDANGSASRSATSANAFASVQGALVPIPPAMRPEVFSQVIRTGQNARCPGSVERPVDGSNPYVPSGVSCDPTQLPPGN
jgi:hypothetical protein